MKRIKSILMIALLLLGVCTTILQAQTATTVTLGGTSYPVIDLTELTPLGCVLTINSITQKWNSQYIDNQYIEKYVILIEKQIRNKIIN